MHYECQSVILGVHASCVRVGRQAGHGGSPEAFSRSVTAGQALRGRAPCPEPARAAPRRRTPTPISPRRPDRLEGRYWQVPPPRPVARQMAHLPDLRSRPAPRHRRRELPGTPQGQPSYPAVLRVQIGGPSASTKKRVIGRDSVGAVILATLRVQQLLVAGLGGGGPISPGQGQHLDRCT